MLAGAGSLTICDLGQARIGNEHSGNAMPVPYRAPEVVLKMKWGNAVDIWSLGLLAWNLSFLFLMVPSFNVNSSSMLGLGPSRTRKSLLHL
jgi:serine/threonine protein kinase